MNDLLEEFCVTEVSGLRFLNKNDLSRLDMLDMEEVILPVFVSLSGFQPVTQSSRLRFPLWAWARAGKPGPGVLAGGLSRQAYSITETAPLFCRHRKNKRRALMRVQEAHLPDSLGPDPPWAYGASGSPAVPPLRLQPPISLCLITFVLASGGALQWVDYSSSKSGPSFCTHTAKTLFSCIAATRYLEV